MTRIVIVGATSTIASQCARIWVERDSVELTLVGRDEASLKRLAKDLKVRNKSTVVKVETLDFAKPRQIQTLVDSLYSKSAVDVVLIAHGVMPEQSDAQKSLTVIKNEVEINSTSVMMFAEAFASAMDQAGIGHIAIIGSVAGDRGRRTNYIYGATKALLATYAEGLAHRFANDAVKVSLIKPGPTSTAMTAKLAAQGRKLADPAVVASQIVQGLDKYKPVIYAPGVWRYIMFVIRHLPRSVFNRLNV